MTKTSRIRREMAIVNRSHQECEEVHYARLPCVFVCDDCTAKARMNILLATLNSRRGYGKHKYTLRVKT